LNHNFPRWSAGALAASLALFASACSVPLAPGYRIVKESRWVQFVPGQPSEVRVRARYTLQNTGTADLAYIDANFPDEHSYGRTDVRVEVDGHAVAAASPPAADQYSRPDALRIPLNPVWARKQTRQLTIDYTFRSPENSGAQITIGENSFYLAARGWLPVLDPPKSVLSPNPTSPKLVDFSVRVPADFTVLARGAPKGKKKDGNEIEYRFELDATSLAAYVVAGKYAEWPAQGKSSSAIFWTDQPLKDDPAAGAQQIVAAWNALEKDFGPLDKNTGGPYVVESQSLRSHVSGDAAPAAVAFPRGAIVNPAALALGTGNDRFVEIVTHALAHDWFGGVMYIAPAAELGMGEGLPEYATIVIDEARGGADARRKLVTEYLRRYDEARQAATETPLAATNIGDALGPRRIALAKAPLFFVALEDACGEEPMRNGVARLLALQRGREAGYPELRAALEESTNRDLAAMFRLWLNYPGIPEDFRQRYQGSAVGQVAQK
jgi:Peptidase family M1 domain